MSLVRRAGSLHRKTGGFGWVQAVFALAVVAVLASLAVPMTPHCRSSANKLKDTSNLRQVGLAIKLYAADHEGRYPVGWLAGTNVAPADIGWVPDANTAFREVLAWGICKDERIFNTPLDRLAWYKELASPPARFVVGDNKMGNPPDFGEALAPGENSYVYFAGLNETFGEGEALACNVVAKDGSIQRAADGVAWEAKGLEPRINSGSGLNILYCDGSVGYVPKSGSSGLVSFGTNSAAAVVKLPLER